MATDALRPAGRHALEDGLAALAAGRWEEAIEFLHRVTGSSAACSDEDVAAGQEALSEALWWLGRTREALHARKHAYARWRRTGDDAAAARAAAWLAAEYAALSGRGPVADGWLARAESLSDAARDEDVAGWVALSGSVLSATPRSQAAAAAQALAHARTARDGDLEALALGRLGLAGVASGDLEGGLRRLDEAMAVATAGETGRSTLAALCCDLVRAAELSGEMDRFGRWQEVITSLAAEHGHPPLIAFCATCCAEAFMAAGDWSGAEQQLRDAIGMLHRPGQPVRCVAPTAKLADLLVAQGRLEEAERLLEEEPSDDALLAQARLALARGDPGSAVILAERHVRRVGGEGLAAATSMLLLVDAHVRAGDTENARQAADRLTAVAISSGHRRTLGRAALGRALAERRDRSRVRAALEEAVDHLSVVAPGAAETAQAHLALARLHAEEAPRLAVTEAKAALAGFDAAGATHAADEVAALLRELGDRTRVGPKHEDVLTRREREVLRLVAEGLSNREIAQRLFISTKTASNHVSHILTKLGVRTRTEAATRAGRELQERTPSRSGRR